MLPIKRNLVLFMVTVALAIVAAAITATTAPAGTDSYCNNCSLYVGGSPAVSVTAYHYDNYIYSANWGGVEIYMYNVSSGITTCGVSGLANSLYKQCANQATSRCHLWDGSGGPYTVYCDTTY